MLKAAWNFTVADLSKTWVVENLDNLVLKYVRKWFDLPVSSTLSGLVLPNSNFGLNLLLPSVKFTQCQTVCRSALRSSQNDDVKSPWKNTNNGMNLQYDIYRDTKDVLKAVRRKTKNSLLTIYRTKVPFFHSYFRIIFKISTGPGLMFMVNCLKMCSPLLSSIFQTLSLLEKI